jgi:hypothetical protein
MANGVLLLSNAAAPGTALLFPVIMQSGTLSADVLGVPGGIFPFDVEVVGINAGIVTNGVDGTDAWQVVIDVDKRADAATSGTSILTTTCTITKAAGAGFVYANAASTGVTPPVLDATKTTIAAGSVLTADFDVTRTTPETEGAGAFVVLWCAPQAGADSRAYGDFAGL